ncbi:hypothetical protein HDV63DRAFT_364753, partial [Trichoderma sp. SZMC 28014]
MCVEEPQLTTFSGIVRLGPDRIISGTAHILELLSNGRGLGIGRSAEPSHQRRQLLQPSTFLFFPQTFLLFAALLFLTLAALFCFSSSTFSLHFFPFSAFLAFTFSAFFLFALLPSFGCFAFFLLFLESLFLFLSF